jgi:CubicO group peptidase (beta-lactamase class C family)
VTLDLTAVDERFAAEFAQGRSPGLVYAVVRDGEILHANGLGTTTLDQDVRPTARSVHRIASMTKSFTASAVLLLRDRGALRLDDPVSAYVPELEGFRHTPDAPDLTIRHLLTMSGGLLTDDPWGDRNESQTAAELGELLAGGFTVGAAPGTRFEYSNLGYAVLGRIVDSLTGGDGGYRRLVLDAITGPLGMAATRYDVREVGPDLAAGHHRRGEEWTVEPEVLPGTFSAMGGLHSTLTDLARWVGGFTDAFRHPDAPHPLSAASRREMQQAQRFVGVSGALSVDVPVGGTALAAAATGYGFGLFVEHHSDHGDVVQHSGGYPGYGSHMRWHPETGLGVIGLANGTYAAPVEACRDALRALVAGQRRPGVPPTATPEIVSAVTAKLGSTAEPFTDGLFASNVALDVPEPERLAQLATARELVGMPVGPAGEPYAGGLGVASWVVPAERGRYDVEIKVAPTREPAVQSLKVTAVPGAPEALASAATRALAGDVGELVLADDLDTDPFRRAVAVAHGLGGTPVAAGVLSGDGADTAAFAVRAGTTWWKLEITGADPVTALALTASPTAEHPWLAHRFGA